MLDDKTLRERRDVLRESEVRRGRSGSNVDTFLEVYEEYRSMVYSREMCQMRKKNVARDVKKGRVEITKELKLKLKELKKEINLMKKKETECMKRRQEFLSRIGNVVSPDVPTGTIDSVVRYFSKNKKVSDGKTKFEDLVRSHFKDYKGTADVRRNLYDKHILKDELPQGYLSENGFEFRNNTRGRLSVLLVFDLERKESVLKEISHKFELLLQIFGVMNGCVTSTVASRLHNASCSERVFHGKTENGTYVPLASFSYCSDYLAREIRCFCGGTKYKIGGVFVKHHCHFVLGEFLCDNAAVFSSGDQAAVIVMKNPLIAFQNPCDEECERLDTILKIHPYLAGFHLSKLDRETFSRFRSSPPRSHFFSLCRWYRNIASYDSTSRQGWE